VNVVARIKREHDRLRGGVGVVAARSTILGFLFAGMEKTERVTALVQEHSIDTSLTCGWHIIGAPSVVLSIDKDIRFHDVPLPIRFLVEQQVRRPGRLFGEAEIFPVLGD
jgi:hypothetical protein